MTKFIPPGEPVVITPAPDDNILQFEVKLGLNPLDEIAAIQTRHEVLAEFAEEQIRSDLETNARLTIIRMFQEAPALDQNFSFKTAPQKGEDYVQAIRQVLSRSRQKLRSRQNTQPPHFKLFLIGIEHLEDHDLVTIVRSAQSRSLVVGSLMDEIAGLIKNEVGE